MCEYLILFLCAFQVTVLASANRLLRADDRALRIYRWPIPDKFCKDVYNKWPKRNIGDYKVLNTHSVYVDLDPALHPFGPSLFGDSDLRMTSQFSVERWFQFQMERSPLTVDSYGEADVVYVCSAAFNSYTWLDKEGNKLIKDFIINYNSFLPHIRDKPHILILPHVARDYWDALAEGIHHLRNFTIAAIEPYTTWDWHMGGPRSEKEALKYNARWVTLPYPSHFHYHTGEAHDNLQSWEPYWVNLTKDVLVTAALGARNTFAWRNKLVHDCKVRPKQCMRVHYINGNISSFLEAIDVTRRSWYCFQPAGDTPLRKSFYDCLLSTTIPVVFHWDVFRILPFQHVIDWEQLLQHFDPDLLDTDINMVDELEAAHTAEHALDKLARVQQVKHVLQYSLQPVHQAIRFDALDRLTADDDAFTMAWKSLMRLSCKRGDIPAHRCTGSKRQYTGGERKRPS